MMEQLDSVLLLLRIVHLSPKYLLFGLKMYQIKTISTNFFFMVNKEIFLYFRQKDFGIGFINKTLKC